MSENTQEKSGRWKRAVALFLVVPVGMLLGGLIVAWISEGPILYSYSTQEVAGRVHANAEGALTGKEDDKRHFILMSYDDCPDVRQALPVPNLATVKKSQLAVATRVRECLAPMTVGSPVKMTVEIRENRVNNKREWRVTRLNQCDTARVPSVVVPGGENRCPWM